jgi:Tol biopolymer transport system component
VTLDSRARRAADEYRRAVGDMRSIDHEHASFERFDRFRQRRQRNQRVGVITLALVITFAAVLVVTHAFPPGDQRQPAVPPTNGRIVFGVQGGNDSNRLFTMDPDGTDVRDLSVKSRCMSWAPDGTKILISDNPSSYTGLPATVNPDGTGYIELDVTTNPYLNLGCGAFSPDGTRIVLGGSTELVTALYHPEVNGIYTMRASDGGDLVRLTRRAGTHPSYSPDGSQVVFQGIQGPNGACGGYDARPNTLCPSGSIAEGQLDGSLFVVNADGTGLHRIASQIPGVHSPPSWSPDGQWILFSAVTAVYVVHPDGTGLRRITLEWVPRLRQADYPSWSPDGTRFVFVGWTGSDRYNLFTAGADGTGVEQITDTRGIYYLRPDWGTNAG